MNARALAAIALAQWRRGPRFADVIIQDLLGGSALAVADRAFALELFYGVLRNLSLLDFWVAQLRTAAVDADARDLLRLGLYQILRLETAEHAAVFETVALARTRTRGLINALLRRAVREKAALLAAAVAQPLNLQYSHPAFLLERWSQHFGEEAALELCRWNNQPAPVYARINQLKISVPDFLTRYPGSALIPENQSFVRLPDPASALRNGDCYIQDPSTALACQLLAPAPAENVLDACAAPGGKTALLAELMQNRGRLVACDRETTRVEKLTQNLARLGLSNALTLRCDWKESARPAEIAGAVFDRILVDAPCSNTGVMRRRVDVRWRLRPEDLERMPNEQLAITRAILPLLKPGGTLVYSTCSLEPEENEQLVAQLLREFPILHLEEECRALPFRDGYDGAFAARLLRHA